MAQAPQAKPAVTKYFDSLDGYRAFGTLVVVMHHVPFIFFRTPFAYGWWVLQSFFVISGYLLTMLQIKEKEKGHSLGKYMKDYYLKRFYRIFPLYWAFLALLTIVILLFGVTKIPLISGLLEEYRDNWFLFWTYTYNYKEIVNFAEGVRPNFNPFLSHMWSLSVEEQFYLILPLLVFFFSIKNLKRIVIGIIVLSPLLRLATYLYFNHLAYAPENNAYFEGIDFYKDSWVSVVILRATWCQMDCFAFGMAIALWRFEWIKHVNKWLFWSFMFFLVLVTLNGIYSASQLDTAFVTEMAANNPILRRAMEIFPMSFIKFYHSVSEHLVLTENYHFIYIYTIVNFLSFLIVLGCIRNKPFLNLFRNKKVVYTGKITYGAYLFHYPLLMLVILFTIPIMAKVSHLSQKFFALVLNDYLGIVGSQITSEIVMMLIYLPLLWFISKLSFEYFEMYFINLKKRIK